MKNNRQMKIVKNSIYNLNLDSEIISSNTTRDSFSIMSKGYVLENLKPTSKLIRKFKSLTCRNYKTHCRMVKLGYKG